VQHGDGWDRREFARASALLAMATGLPVAVVRASAAAKPARRHRNLIADVSQCVLPRTATPGAGEVGVGDFVILALAHGLERSRVPIAGAAATTYARFLRPDRTLRHLDWLDAELNRRANGNFLRTPVDARMSVLAALDAEAFAPGTQDHPWKTIKALILTGYYTSEVGGSQELRYELVPGRWDPDLPAAPDARAFSSDWTAVDFG